MTNSNESNSSEEIPITHLEANITAEELQIQIEKASNALFILDGLIPNLNQKMLQDIPVELIRAIETLSIFNENK